MKQFILIIAILMLSLPVSAKPKNENNIITGEQVYFETPESDYERKVEPDISLAARDFNNRGIEKALTEKNFEAAAELFRQAVESDQRCFTCKYNLGISLIKSEKNDEALNNFIDLVSRAPLYSNAYAGLGEAYHKKGLYKNSVAAYEKAISLEKKEALLFSNLGDALFQIKEYKKALIYLNKAIEINPNLPVAHINRGAVLHVTGRYKEAVESLKRSLTLQPNSAEAHNNIGVVLVSLGKEKEAHRYYLEAVRLSPKWDVALYNLAVNNLTLKKRDEAQRQIAVLEDVSPDLAKDLKKLFFGKYLIDVSDVK